MHERKLVIIFILTNSFFAIKSSYSQNTSDIIASVILRFDNVAGNNDLKLDSGLYTNTAGEKFTVTLLQYFISNIRFTTARGSQYIVPQNSCYFLINEEDSASQFCSIHIPSGTYTAISFMVGVDSLRNTMDIDKRTGVLDPTASDMYWQWNSGYICLKIEGISSAAAVDPLGLHKYRYHIGGFGGYTSHTLSNIKTVTLDLINQPIIVAANKITNLHILADVLKVFSGASNVSIAQHASVMFNPYSSVIANNYAGMFRLAGSENK